MSTVNDYPESCAKAVQTIVRKMGVDSKTAYAMLSLEAAMYDMSPSDEKVLSMLLEDCQPCG